MGAKDDSRALTSGRAREYLARSAVVVLAGLCGAAVSMGLTIIYSDSGDYEGWGILAPIVLALLGGTVIALGAADSWSRALDEARLFPTVLWSLGLSLWGAMSVSALGISLYLSVGGQHIGRVLGVLVAIIFFAGVAWTLKVGDPGERQVRQVARWLFWQVAAGAGLLAVTMPLHENSADLQVYGALLGGFWVAAGAGALFTEPLRFWYASRAAREEEARVEQQKKWERRAYILRESEYRYARLRRRTRPWRR